MRRSPISMSVLLLALILAPGSLPAEEGAPEPTPAFPSSWRGVWVGPCVNRVRGGPTHRFPMELHVAPVEGKEAWTWTIVYGEGPERQVRPYEIRPVDAKTGHWLIDERNGILIDAYLVDDALHSRFEVAGNVIDVRYRMRDGGIDVVLTTCGKTPIRSSGGEGRIPPVQAFGLKSAQSGRLTRATAR